MAKPSLKPEWATGVADIVEPSGVKKGVGWIIEKPPFQFFNWLFNLIYLWIVWFDQGYRGVQLVTAAGTTALGLGSKIVYCDATLGNQILTLPDVASDDGMVVTVIKTDASANTVTVQSAVALKTISGEATQVIENQNTALNMNAYSTNWYLS